MPNICQRLPWLVSFWQLKPIRLQHYANVIFVFNRPFSFQIKRIHKKDFNGKLANPLLCVYNFNCSFNIYLKFKSCICLQFPFCSSIFNFILHGIYLKKRASKQLHQFYRTSVFYGISTP